ncbi:hypothetical protein A1O1_07281 [Capronia coronata CBS 617.96]|uniref:Uncharacterized protein n=1 Tax=Capronia coronata CBS 617.96 TaxID=1182541 RepID=W9XSW5_9EURO|nr:uncharacterized protein A1O1_07281 [Capronia coronata CBS 617.96]EXJ83657.1 hypothetical protein A1O1_07281 [Capronia coronata CBS 617.96]
MSQLVKRDADTAFEGSANGSPHALKRQRKRRARKSEDEDALKPPKTESSPTAVSSAKQTRKQAAKLQDIVGPTQVSKVTDKTDIPPKSQVEELMSKSAGAEDGPAGKPPSTEDTTKAIVKKPKRAQQKFLQIEKRRGKQTEVDNNGWSLSPSTGGVFVDQDPLLTDNDQYLILPTHSEIHVYSTKTSLLVRSFRVDNKSDITSCALSSADPRRVYVTSSRGLLSLFDWTTGEKLSRHNTGRGLQQVLPLTSVSGKETILALQDVQSSKSALIFDANLFTNQLKEITTVLHRVGVAPIIRSFASGSVLIACAADRLLVGQSQIDADGKLSLDYTWREVSVSAPILSFDAQINVGKSKSGRKVPLVDVVLGLNSGVIVYYEDLLFKLIGKEKKNSTDEIVARKLHWHRTGVNSVKWSRDGNYIISGGNETVLVIWQLDTNQRQYLPHLSTPILGLTVSATGSAYALRLGDNSVMVLSTADLLPFSSISGLALGDVQSTSSTMLLHPTSANRLLAAATANAVTHGSRRGRGSTLLQVYDLESNLQLGRQALTRNMTTAKNVAPSGDIVREPNVTHVAISHDGKWLATVDEWQPNEQDIETMYIDADDASTRGAAVETTLKFWHWNEDEGTWELVTRVDEPHKPGVGSVLGLSVNPTKVEITTIGSDASVRLWTPKARHRNGVAVKNQSNEQLYTWATSKTINCESEAQGRAGPATSAAVTYSDDGSVLTASWSGPASAHRYVQLIDPATGQICGSQPDLLSPGEGKLAFVGRYLVCLSQYLNIFDTLTSRIVASVGLDPEYVAPGSNSPSHLATNKLDGTVAVSISRADKPRATKLVVLSLRTGELKCVHETSFTGALKGLLALTTTPGYLMIDDKNRCRSLRPAGAWNVGHGGSADAQQESDLVTRSLDSIFGKGHTTAVAEASQAGREPQRLLTAASTDATATNPTSGAGGLDSVLNIVSSTQAPTPEQLFQRVVGVLARA